MSDDRSNNQKWFIAVHCGAGVYSKESVNVYKELMKQACRVAAQRLTNNTNGSLDALCDSISVLENSEYTNAGIGSNLNEDGKVECDSCVALYDNTLLEQQMNRTMYGSVGAVYGVQNPILLAKEVLLDCKREIGVLGRVKPLLLCGKGAYLYARNTVHCRHLIVEPDQLKAEKFLITAKTMQTYYDHSNRVKHAVKQKQQQQQQQEILQQQQQPELFYDTVGAICSDSNGNMSAGVSSGGLSLKYPGRVGEAAIYGSGCYASNIFSCSCTGVGEDIMLNQIASKCAMYLENDIASNVNESIEKAFSIQESGFLPHHTKRGVGILASHRAESSSGTMHTELCWAYTTPAMAVAYLSSVMKEPVAFVSFHKKYDTTSNNIQMASLTI
jgi:taspase (threonine aspartase 1)